jgi:RNA-directed DNA polymerase
MGREGFDFLGLHFHKLKSRRSGKLAPYMWPGQKAMKKAREKIHRITSRNRISNSLADIVRSLNPVITGWRNYFKAGNSSKQFQNLDRYLCGRVRMWILTSKGKKWRGKTTELEDMLNTCGLRRFYQ